MKDTIHFVYGAELPHINTQATPQQIKEWKDDVAVARCYRKLFRRINPNEPATFMSKIIEKLRKDKKEPSKVQLAYAISISETYMCPDVQGILITESIKPKIVKNLVSFNFNFA